MKKLCLLLLVLFLSLPALGAEKEDYYKILGVKKTADAEEIKKAYRRAAMKFHPDRFSEKDGFSETDRQQARENFQKAKEAYEVLRDPAKRAAYNDFGHQAASQASQGNHAAFTEVFKDIFGAKTTAAPKEFSPKALQLFQAFYIQGYDAFKNNSKSSAKKARAALKALLKEQDMPNLNAQTQARLLKDFYPFFKLSGAASGSSNTGGGQKAQNSLHAADWSLQLESFVNYLQTLGAESLLSREERALNLFKSFSFLNTAPKDYIQKEERYRELKQKEVEGQKLSPQEASELKAFEKQNKKDIRIFKRILSVLGLPGHTHHEFLLQAYLKGLKEKLLAEAHSRGGAAAAIEYIPPGAKKKASSRPQSQFYAINKMETLEVLKNIKGHFDIEHYKMLKDGANPFSMKFLKSFPLQLVVFQAAIGASLFRQAASDPYFYGDDRNPGMIGESMEHLISPTGILSFYIFVAVSHQINYRMYGWGRFMDGKSVGGLSFTGKAGRALGPGVGLGLGFFVSTLFDQALRDPDLRQCAKSLFKDKQAEQNQNSLANAAPRSQLSACERFSFQWGNSLKWQLFAVDAGTLIASGLLSHKLVHLLLSGIRSIGIGSRALLAAGRFLTQRGSMFAGMLFNMYVFMELHKILDHCIGQHVKKKIAQDRLKNDLIELKRYFNKETFDLSIYSEAAEKEMTEAAKERMQKKTNEIKEELKENMIDTGLKFKNWTGIKNIHYGQSASLWGRELNKLLMPYEGAKALLTDIHASSHFSYGRPAGDEEKPWDTEKEITGKKMDSYFNQMNAFAAINPELFKESAELFRSKFCADEKEMEGLETWNIFCKEQGNLRFEMLAYDIFKLIYNRLNQIHYNNPPENLEIASYIGAGINEMFSPDPENSPLQLPYKDRIYLAKLLIKAGLNPEEAVSHFPPQDLLKLRAGLCAASYPGYRDNEEAAELYDMCANPQMEKINGFCEDFAKNRIQIIREYISTMSDQDLQDNGVSSKEEALMIYAGSSALENKKQSCRDSLLYIGGVEHLSNKLLTAAVYLLQDAAHNFSKFQSMNSEALQLVQAKHDPHNVWSSLNYLQAFKSAIPLIKVFTARKKGEGFFLFPEELLSQQKKEIEKNKGFVDSQQSNELERIFSLSKSPYWFAKALLCGEERKEENLFKIPKVFKMPEALVYNFYTKKYESLPELCGQFKSLSQGSRNYGFHHALFNRPTQIQGQKYENLYLAMESFLKNNFENNTSLNKHFTELSKSQLNQIGSRLSSSLNIITENYYKNMISYDNPLNEHSDRESFMSYYSENRVLSFIDSFLEEGGFKGLEISIFQINYWMNRIKQILSIGEAKDKNGKAFNKKASPAMEFFDKQAFEKAQLEILKLLQSYQNSYKKSQGPYLKFPGKKFAAEMTELFKKGGKECFQFHFNSPSFLEASLKRYRLERAGSTESLLNSCAAAEEQGALLQPQNQLKGAEEGLENLIKKQSAAGLLPVFFGQTEILSHILAAALPTWNNYGIINTFIRNGKTSSEEGSWKLLVESAFFELSRSLDNFYEQISGLQLKDSFDTDRSEFYDEGLKTGPAQKAEETFTWTSFLDICKGF